MFTFLYTLPILLLLYATMAKKRKQFHIRKWQKSLNLQEHSQIFEQLYQNTNGFALSQQARQSSDALDYTYGEIEFFPFIALLSLAKPDENTIFYDLGCGVGKAVLACAMVYPIRKSVGIEILPPLYSKACQLAKKLEVMNNYADAASKIEFISGDFLEANLNEATYIFINASAFFNPTWEKLCSRLDHLPHLITVITTSKTLNSNVFSPIVKTKIQMSWGVVSAYIHVRKKVKNQTS